MSRLFALKVIGGKTGPVAFGIPRTEGQSVRLRSARVLGFVQPIEADVQVIEQRRADRPVPAETEDMGKPRLKEVGSIGGGDGLGTVNCSWSRLLYEKKNLLLIPQFSSMRKDIVVSR